MTGGTADGEAARDWPYIQQASQVLPKSAVDIGVATTLQSSGPAGGQCAEAPFSAPPFTNWSMCNRTMAISDSCPWNSSDLSAMLDYASSLGVTHASVWRSDIDEECFNGTAPFMYGVLARWLAGAHQTGGTAGTRQAQQQHTHTAASPRRSSFPLPAAGSGVGGSSVGGDPPAAGGECSFSCAPGRPGCPLTVLGDRCGYMYTVMTGNLANLIANGTAAKPAARRGTAPGSRSLPSGALSLLMSQCQQPGKCNVGVRTQMQTHVRTHCRYTRPNLLAAGVLIVCWRLLSFCQVYCTNSAPPVIASSKCCPFLPTPQCCTHEGGCCPPTMAACVQPPAPPACDSATALLRRFKDVPGTSFGGQAFPLLWHTFGPSCYPSGADRAWLLGLINASLPMTQAEATPQEVSYTNMWLMSTVNAILFGEIVGGERGRKSADVGYAMWDAWRNYTAETGGLHEFTSPT